ncbi:ubiquitin-conjugating enzyme E2 D4-like [Saccoglossus kowalevskii]
MSLSKQLTGRLQKELTLVQKSPPCGIKVQLLSDNLYLWNAEIPGPKQSLYKGGKFKVQISFPDNYPMAPPLVHFLTPIYHLNVSQNGGQVCLGLLNNDTWVASGNMEQVPNALFSILIKPEEDNAFDHEILNNYHHFRWTYDDRARESARKAK